MYIVPHYSLVYRPAKYRSFLQKLLHLKCPHGLFESKLFETQRLCPSHVNYITISAEVGC